jgi:hypothetical protein
MGLDHYGGGIHPSICALTFVKNLGRHDGQTGQDQCAPLDWPELSLVT